MTHQIPCVRYQHCGGYNKKLHSLCICHYPVIVLSGDLWFRLSLFTSECQRVCQLYDLLQSPWKGSVLGTKCFYNLLMWWSNIKRTQGIFWEQWLQWTQFITNYEINNMCHIWFDESNWIGIVHLKQLHDYYILSVRDDWRVYRYGGMLILDGRLKTPQLFPIIFKRSYKEIQN